MQPIELPYAVMRYKAPVIHVLYKAGAQLGFIEIRELIRTAENLAGYMPYVVLSDVRAGVSVTPMGKKVVSDPNELPLHRGTAVVVTNSLMKLAANFFDKLNPAPYPFRAFTNEQQATRWLLSLSLEAQSEAS